MTSIPSTAPLPARLPEHAGPDPRTLTRLRAAAALRIAFGLVWAVDAALKWMPGFIEGQTLPDELGRAEEVGTPVMHEWLLLWNRVGLADPSLFAHVVAIVETAVAVLLVLGLLSRTTLLASAVLSLGIWTGAEGMHLPWFRDGQTDLGPSVGYVIASLGLCLSSSGAVWSVDSLLARRRGGALGRAGSARA